jgi:lincosamide nucleotidyltransferase A/C/D/E
MRAKDVVRVLARLRQADATAWVDGGWGIDALLGQTSRSHSDLDLVVLRPELPAVRSALAEDGYTTILRDWLPTALALADAAGREIDLHPVTPTPDGGGNQALADGTEFHYSPPSTGSIAGHRVACVDVETQIRCHLGYEPSTKDRDDMRRLRDRFGVALPAPYQ